MKAELSLDTCSKLCGFGASRKGSENDSQNSTKASKNASHSDVKKQSKSRVVAGLEPSMGGPVPGDHILGVYLPILRPRSRQNMVPWVSLGVKGSFLLVRWCHFGIFWCFGHPGNRSSSYFLVLWASCGSFWLTFCNFGLGGSFCFMAYSSTWFAFGTLLSMYYTTC